MKRQVKQLVRHFGFELKRLSPEDTDPHVSHLKWLDRIRSGYVGDDQLDQFAAFCATNFRHSKSQLFQDLLVLFLTDGKRGGYFVEFGATDGVGLSNTYLLETEYGWRGVLAEPARCWHESLRQNRRADISLDCVWSKSGETLTFRETEWREVSTVDKFASLDQHAAVRESANRYDVMTISLCDLLSSHNAPREIDYLSIDTEGSEYEILRAHDFGRWRFQIITVEHNFTGNRSRIQSLLESNGYRRVLDAISQFDDWYVFCGS